ncbi:MAG: hypothetical protein V1850_00890 [Candidatus Bathyarchaeota archaeon]
MCVELRLFLTIEDADLEFQNSMVKIVALGSLQELSVAETSVGPLQEGKEYTMRYWIALILVKAGYARFYEDDSMTLLSLNKVHWRETKLQIGRQISPLPEFFYSKLRRYLGELKQKATSNASFAGEYNQALRLAHDIVNCRLKKIANLATYSQEESALKSLSIEERSIFEGVSAMVLEWTTKIMDMETSK